MSIYIHGAKMPKKDDVVTLRIWGYGAVERLESYHNYLLRGVKAMDVPSHGRLIDADAVIAAKHYFLHRIYDDRDFCVVEVNDINNAPTVIPEDTIRETPCEDCPFDICSILEIGSCEAVTKENAE